MNDDPTINNDAILWRRIHKTQLVPDTRGGVRPSSAAFDNHRDGSPMSVALAEIFLKIKNDPADYLKGHTCVGSVSFSAGLARKLDQGIVRSPIDDEPAHAVVIGDKPKSIQRKFAYSGEIRWVVRPPMGIIEEIKNKS